MDDPEKNDEPQTPPGRSGRSRRREKRKRSRSPEERRARRRRRSRKSSHGLSTEDVLKILSAWKGESSKTNVTFHSNQLNNVIPEYDPVNRAQSIECWLRKVNECSQIYGWDEKQTIHFSLQKLVGLAKRWFETLPSVVFTWDEWQAKLKRAFPSEENYGRLLEEMLARTSRSDESLREYFYDKLSLLNRCELGGKKACDCIIHGIHDRSVRNGAQALNCTEPEGLLNFLCSQRLFTPSVNRSKERISQKPTSTATSSTSQTSTANDRSVICFNCRMKGHPYSKCTKPLIKCKQCKRIGHDNESCKLQPIAESPASSSIHGTEKKVLKVTASSRCHEKFFKTVFVGCQQLTAFIDFGSECSLIRQSEAESLGIDKCYDNVPVVKGFGNSSILPLYKSFIKLILDDIEASLEVLVVSNQYMQNAMLIGQNFTELPYITVLKDSAKLTFYKTPIDNPFCCDTPCKLFALESIKVSVTSLVPVTVNDPSFTGDVYIDGYNSYEPGREYRLLPGAYHVSDGVGAVVVTNLSQKPLEIEANALVARSTPFTEADTCQVNRIESNLSNVEPLDRTQIKVGQGLDDECVKKLHELLDEYRDCFATNLSEIGCAKGFDMKIDLLDNKPVVYRPYRLSFSEREQVREVIDDLLRNDIIQESSSDYASPILMVQKKTGEQRLCIDFRALNNKTVKDRFPLPLIEDQLTNLSGNRFFITLDLASGYYQIPMAPESRHLTGFITPDGHYEFKRMPFGLANAPAVFQRMINRILGNKRFEFALAYLDDLLIPSASIEQGFQRLKEILDLLREFGLTLKLSKCRFFDTSIDYLGYRISSEGIEPGEGKLLAVKEFPVPGNVHEVRQFLGLTGYFRKFIQSYGEISRPLTDLLKKDTPWKWTQNQDAAFTLLKEKLLTKPVLALYDHTLETEVHTDASALGIGGILMQWQSNPRVLKPVAYFSRQTTPDEKHLHSYELETLAVVCSLKKFRVYLMGMPFKVFTDCAALKTTLTKRDLIPRIARWWLQISEFNFEIEYRPGVNMMHADALSRNTGLVAEPDDNVALVYNIETNNWLLTLQMADSEISRIVKVLKPENDEECREIKQNYLIKNNAVYRKVDSNSVRLVVPRSARWQVCKANHDDIGHLGFAKTLERIQSQFWFTKLRRFVKKYVSACLECAFNKDNAARRKEGHIYPIEKISIPFHTVHIDHLGPFVKSRNGNSFILTIVDGFTKYLFVRAVRNTKTKSTVKILEKIFYDFGVPARIISDRGTSFTSAAFKSFCDEHGIKHVLNAVACPRANGQAERYNQTILNSLSAQNANGNERDWDRCLGKIQWGINNTINTTTQKTATETLFGVKMRDDLSNKLDISSDAPCTDLAQIRNNVSTIIKNKQERVKQKHNSVHAPAVKYQVGDLVKLSRTNYHNDGKSSKLLSKFTGPYKIVETLGNDRYKITDVPGFNKKGKRYEGIVAADRLRPWIHIQSLELAESDDDSDSNTGSNSE